ncbi:MAG: alpha/beta hydrolase [Balneolaceae bacterium]|nr:MAG: alpha/beta hydrolase [Balneolaceae bacterium]
MKTLYLILSGLHFACISFAQENQIITSDGVELHVTVKGNGLPVLYLHGGPGSGSYWMEVFMGEYLEQQFRMIYLDQRGVGRSGSPSDGNFSLDRFVQDFEEVRQSLGIEKWLTMGHSFGGILQTAYSERHPEVVSGMMIINGSLNMSDSFKSSWCPKASEFLGISEPLPCLDKSVPMFDRWGELINGLNEKNLMWKMGYTYQNSIDKMNQTYRDIENWNPDFSNSFIEYDEYMADFRPISATLDMPVLFYYGNYDWMIGPDHHKGVSFPNMLLWAGDTGHMPFLENRDDLKSAIDAYLDAFSF